MKQTIACFCLFVACCGWGDAVNDAFLSLRTEGRTALTEFYHSLSNGLVGMNGVWKENGSLMDFTVTNVCGGVSNVEYGIKFMVSGFMTG